MNFWDSTSWCFFQLADASIHNPFKKRKTERMTYFKYFFSMLFLTLCIFVPGGEPSDVR